MKLDIDGQCYRPPLKPQLENLPLWIRGYIRAGHQYTANEVDTIIQTVHMLMSTATSYCQGELKLSRISINKRQVAIYFMDSLGSPTLTQVVYRALQRTSSTKATLDFGPTQQLTPYARWKAHFTQEYMKCVPSVEAMLKCMTELLGTCKESRVGIKQSKVNLKTEGDTNV